MKITSILASAAAVAATLGLVTSSIGTTRTSETHRPEIQEEQEQTAPCCFSHPRELGLCEVVPNEDETCESILEYLNTPMSADKNYCGGTEIRGDWESVSCEEG